MSQRKKLSKLLLSTIITIVIALVFLSAILITNIFIPVKYLSAYINFNTDKPRKGEMRISFINVGDGDCTLVEFPDGKVALFDGGDGSYNNQLKIFGKLNSFKIDKIDYLFCTSSSAKRCGGLAEIVKYKQIGKIFAPIYKNSGVTEEYRNFRKEVKNKKADLNECAYGVGEYNEEYGYSFYVLYPEKTASVSESDSVHYTCVWISYSGISLLLLGDLKNSELNELYDKYTVVGVDINGTTINMNDCNIVKASKGGAESGVYAPFYDLIQAETAIISTAKEPSLALLSNLSLYAGNNIYRTDKHGTVTLNISDGAYSVKKER